MIFEEKVRGGAYDNPLPYSLSVREIRDAYNAKEAELYDTFISDLTAYLIENNVPKEYARKVAVKAYSDGHGSGYSEVFNTALGLMEIFE
jgi:hypothetical protein